MTHTSKNIQGFGRYEQGSGQSRNIPKNSAKIIKVSNAQAPGHTVQPPAFSSSTIQASPIVATTTASTTKLAGAVIAQPSVGASVKSAVLKAVSIPSADVSAFTTSAADASTAYGQIGFVPVVSTFLVGAAIAMALVGAVVILKGAQKHPLVIN